jgi:tape measure domain-containing protein
MAGKKTLTQRIALDGGKDIKRELEALGADGKKAFEALKKAAEAANPALTGVNRHLVTLRNQVGVVQQRFAALGRSISPLTRGMAQLGASFAAAFSVRALIDMTSAWTDLNSQVALTIPETEEVNDVMKRLQQTARGTYSSLQTTVEGFIQNSAVLKELGMTTQQQLDFQESLNNAMVVSGIRGDKARQVTEALTRAMSLGALRGQNLNMIMQNGGRITTILAEHFGVTRGELLKLGAAGQITSDVIQEALLNNMGKLRDEAASMPATIADGFILIQNALLAYVGTGDQATGTSAAIADALIWVADNIDLVMNAVLLLAGAFALVKGIALAQALISIGAALVGLLPPLAAIGAALLANPMTLWALAIVAAAAAVLALTGNLDSFVDVIGKTVTPIFDAMKAMMGLGDEGEEALGNSAEKAQDLGMAVTGTTDHLVKMTDSTVDAGDELGEMGSTGESAANDVTAAINDTTSSIVNLVTEVENAITALNSMASAANAAKAATSAATGSGSAPGYAGGGAIRGAGTGTSDSILARLSNGEYVVRAAAVRKYGVGMLNALNGMKLPKFNLGGAVGDMFSGMGSRPVLAGVSNMGASGRPFNLNIGGETFEGLVAPADVAERLMRYAMGRQVRSAGRRPNWHGGGT